MLVVLVIALGGVVFTLIGLNGGGTPERGIPAYQLEERALAMSSPSLVFMEVTIAGYLKDDTGTFLRTTPITFKRRCSGFVVNPDGHVLTNGSCVKPPADIARERALYTLGRILIAEQKLAAKDLDKWVKTNMEKTVFTGIDPLADPEIKLYAQLNVATGDLTDDPAIPGEIVKVVPPDAGNLALVKLAQENLPAVELSDGATIDPEASLLIVGYGTNDTEFKGAAYTLRSKSVQVTGTGSQGSVSVYRLSDDIGIYSHGGMALDNSGRVIGILDNDRSRTDGANRAVVPASAMIGLLNEAGVHNTLGESDKRYRSALDAYFTGSYSKAAAEFDQVLRDTPVNLVAATYRQYATDRNSAEGDASGTSPWVTSLVAALGGALVVGIVFLAVHLLRQRTGRREASTF